MLGTDLELLKLYLEVVIDGGRVDKAPGIEEWPGDFETPPPLKTVTMEIKSNYYDWYPTGYYLPAGQEATLQVKNSIINTALFHIYFLQISSFDVITFSVFLPTHPSLLNNLQTKPGMLERGFLHSLTHGTSSPVSSCLPEQIPQLEFF